MWGFKQEGGLGGLVGKKKKKKNNEYNVVILFMRGVPAIPCAYPTRCVGCFNIHPGEKKKKINCASCRGTRHCEPTAWHHAELSHDGASGREKKARKINSKGRGVMRRAKRGQRNFPTIIKMVCEHHVMGSSRKTWTFHQRAADSLRNSSVFACVYLSECAFPHRKVPQTSASTVNR